MQLHLESYQVFRCYSNKHSFPFDPSWMLLTYIQFHVPCWMQMQLTYIQNSVSPVECYSRTFWRICCPHSNARTLQSCKSLTRIRCIADQSHRSQQYLTQHPSSLNTLKATFYSYIISTSQTANVPSSQCHWSTNASKWHVDTSSNIALNILYPQTLDISLLVLFLLIGRSRRARPCKDSHISIGICRDFISMNIRYCSVNLWLHISGIQSGKVALHVTSSRAR